MNRLDLPDFKLPDSDLTAARIAHHRRRAVVADRIAFAVSAGALIFSVAVVVLMVAGVLP
jgi:hypothetical protein